MWIGRKAWDEELKCGRMTLEICEQIKYLGLILTHNLKWDGHLTYLEEKNSKLIRLINAVTALTGNLDLNNKMTIYRQVYLTTLLYCHEIWAAALNNRQKDQLKSLQRKTILAMTGAFSSTNNSKLLDLIGVLEVNEEIAYQNEIKGEDHETRKRIKADRLAAQRERLQGDRYEPMFNEELVRKIRRKETFWFLTGHGPFATYSVRFNKNETTNCRLCRLVDETPRHLLHDCASFKENVERNSTDLVLFEEKCREIAFRLYSV